MFSFLAIFLFSFSSFARELAWNGYAPPDSTKLGHLTPYHVPPGARGYLPSSKFISYSGRWTQPESTSSLEPWTDEADAAVRLDFTGTGIEWFGSRGREYGMATVYIDGVRRQQVDAWQDTATVQKQQRLFWAFDLFPGKHHIRIVNEHWKPGSKGYLMNLCAFVVTSIPSHPVSASDSGLLATNNFASLASVSDKSVKGKWSLVEKGFTGVHAMQLSVISATHAIILDKVEHNPLTIDGHPAWGALYNLNTHAVTPLRVKSNSFCAGGTFLSNGTFLSVGGNPVVEDRTSVADFGDVDGLQALRIFEPCLQEDVESCEIREFPERLRMASPRWYPTVTRLHDGSAAIIGGSKKGGWINNSTVNNPSIEFFPCKSIHGSNCMPIQLDFLIDTLNSNLFPIVFMLPNGKLFIAANNDAMIYDWATHSERRLPSLPNGVRVTYPMAGSGLLLPLSPHNNYSPEVILCGGSTLDDRKPSWEISSQDPASTQCSRMLLTEDGINSGWQVEHMPQPRTMPDLVLLPNGLIVIVNGARSGISGYGNVQDQVGLSNADNPVLRGAMYDPSAPHGQRFFSDGMPTSRIPRLYHSVATLTPSGEIMIAGSNPNLDRSAQKYGTEYRVEWLQPPYMKEDRPKIIDGPNRILFAQTVTIKIECASGTGLEDVEVSLMDLGFVTHAVHANSRMVKLVVTELQGDRLTLIGPPSPGIYPPGPGWLYVLVKGVPSKGKHVMLGDGSDPPVERAP